MSNYNIITTTKDIKWPAYVSTVILENENMDKAANVLEKALVTLEAYNGPNFTCVSIELAKRTGIFLYDIIADLRDGENQIKSCHIMILNEPWMKANSIAQACFEFLDEDGAIGDERLIMKRKKGVKYYKNNEVLYEERDYKLRDRQGSENGNLKVIISNI